jgi:thiamine-monophosphate kinase
MKEFELIRRIQQQTSTSDLHNSGVKLGIGDDAAVLEVPQGQYLVATTDTLNVGVHFPNDTSASDIGYKSLAVNLSDMAAMGATPRWVLLSLSLPYAALPDETLPDAPLPDHALQDVNASWVESFTAGFNTLARAHNVSLVGGDTTSGPLSITITAMGLVSAGRQLTRAAAKPGDLLVVSGTIGGAARVLELLQSGLSVTERHLLDRPQPRVELGQKLIDHASACIDISDGLLADLGHILKASDAGARVEIDKLPHPLNLSELECELKWQHQLSGGDDYELLFTLPPDKQEMLKIWSEQLEIKLSIIGEIEEQRGIRCICPDGSDYAVKTAGFEHFEHST